ncbi:MAG TPA: hypothetical protein VJC15_04380 [Candidatus Paceibacterota bacterium]
MPEIEWIAVAVLVYLVFGAMGTVAAWRPDLEKNRGAGIRGVILMWVVSIPVPMSFMFDGWGAFVLVGAIDVWTLGLLWVLSYSDSRLKQIRENLMHRRALS